MDQNPRNGLTGAPILNFICHVNPGNEKSIAWVQDFVRIHWQ